MELINKLAILADAAKYDASCSSSGASGRDSTNSKSAIGSTTGSGICHSYTPDGRCISLLKILLTNFCIYDCLYCVNRHSSNVQRARFTPEEVIQLTLDFYKRNYIEGLFLSSGIIRNPDYTMEQLIEVAKKLRLEHHYRGYIHLKTIPDAHPLLIQEAGLYADRLSINIELPTNESLKALAPEKNTQAISQSMALVNDNILQTIEDKREAKKIKLLPSSSNKNNIIASTAPVSTTTLKPKKVPNFAPAGQSTQMIIGADKTNDQIILKASSELYGKFNMRRVYYSAFSPIPDASKKLPLIEPPLIREHRLYQADWLLRFYQFSVDEITSDENNGMLDLDIDPKLAWALLNREFFPVDVNKASKEVLLRIPGIGPKSVGKIIRARRFQALRLDDLKKMRVSLNKIKCFICCKDYHPRNDSLSSEALKQQVIEPQNQQLGLF